MPIFGNIACVYVISLLRFSEHRVEILVQFGVRCKCTSITRSFLPVCVGFDQATLSDF